MASNDEEPRRSSAEVTLGQDLSTFSVHELTARIQHLQDEITRTQAARARKEQDCDAAELLFGGRSDNA